MKRCWRAKITEQQALKRSSQRAGWLLQLALTLAAFAYLLHISDFAALGRAFHAAPLWCVPAATATLLVIVFVGSLRWRLLMHAYGAKHPPAIGWLYRLQLIGLFYNMLPGAVGGDVLRGVVSRRAFGTHGVSAGLAVVLIERVFGLIGLMLLVVSTLALHPIPGLQVAPWVFGIGFLACVASIVGIACGRRVAPYLPELLAQRARELPQLTHVAAFIAALAMSVLNQALVGVMGHLVVGPLAPDVQLIDSLVLAPLAFAAIFFPLTVAGAGTRDAAMVSLYGLLGVHKERALTASLEILLCYVLSAALGAWLSAITVLSHEAPEPTESTQPIPNA